MGQQIAQVMTKNPYGVMTTATLNEAAQMMRDQEIGDVLVMRADGTLCGLVTDRDLVVRGLAEGLDPRSAT
ncbi:MAG TPA: CBS domain-containing protein, partial [Acidimicrobiia bacterium]|nr:CBS domain-containing protein [Acidimicrobiia bacterium]